MASTIADLDAAIAALTTGQATLQNDIGTLIVAVDALIAKVGQNPDYANEVAAVQAATDALQAEDASVKDETTKAQGA